jgi:hypothetical protein
MQTADVGALVNQRLDATEGEIVDVPYGGSMRTGRQPSGPRAETFVSAVNSGDHFNIFVGAPLLSGEGGTKNGRRATVRVQRLHGKPHILQLKLGPRGYKLREPRTGRPHFPIPTACVGGVDGSHEAVPVDSWLDTVTNEICVLIASFISDQE